jgi:nitrite reductase/ring-hydroxylating ferredoxin subunit
MGWSSILYLERQKYINIPDSRYCGDEHTTLIFAIRESELKESEPSFVSLGGISIILIKKEGRLYTLRNKCSHMWCSFKGARLEGYILKCPCHDWRYDIRTGEFIDAREIRLESYQTKREGGEIFIDIYLK